ncbi:MAG: hypothetical protein PHC94_10960 [Methylobacter sp.]|nr:hypothetical protein [Methylobacter sp.]
MIGQRAIEKQHQEAVLNKESVRSITRMIKEIERIESLIKGYIDADESLKKAWNN